MASTLTRPALKELEELLKNSRRFLSEVYREYRVGSTLEEIAEARGKRPREIEELFSALRILFGRKALPRAGDGRQQAIYEADYFLRSDEELSPELEDHFRKILHKAEGTNLRRSGGYTPPTPPEKRVTREELRRREHRESAVYVLTRKSYLHLSKITAGPLLLKIGWSDSVRERLSSAQTWDPDPIEVLRVFPCEHPHRVETKLHIVLDTLGLRYDGGGGREWFTVDLDLIDQVAASLGLKHSPDFDPKASVEG